MLDKILASRKLGVVFQPIVDLASGELFAFEVLGRAPADLRGEPTYVPPSPSELLEQAWRAGRLAELDHAWRSIALQRVARSIGQSGCAVFLNVDTRVIEDASYTAGHTRRIIEAQGLSTRQFVLELTERDPMLGGKRIEMLTAHYRREGFRIALDDWGTAWSSVDALLRCRPDYVKIDRSLVAGLDSDILRSDFLGALVQLCRSHAMAVIGEGIENERELFSLMQAGVGLGQGYLLGSPATTPTMGAHVTRMVAGHAGRVAGRPALSTVAGSRVHRIGCFGELA
jgi:EAL domain-containing protein (putative c-di-GMP-specific phosphodiesterase class I)